MARTATVVLARFEVPEDARGGFTALQNHGVDAADIRIGGERAEALEAETQVEGERERLDNLLGRFVTRRVVLGAVIGAGIGAVVGVVLAAILAPTTEIASSDRVGLFVALAIMLGVIGSVLGVFVSFERSVGYDDTWQLMLDPEHPGSTWVAVRVSRPAARDSVIETLRSIGHGHGPSDVQVRTVATQGESTVRW
jgi:hypothetical protein